MAQEVPNTSGIYRAIAILFLFQAFHVFSITPLPSLYPPEGTQTEDPNCEIRGL